jgi:hypothetical protein
MRAIARRRARRTAVRTQDWISCAEEAEATQGVGIGSVPWRRPAKRTEEKEVLNRPGAG